MSNSGDKSRPERGEKLIKTGRIFLRILDSAFDFAVLLVLVLMIGFSVYAIWDSQQVYTSASPANYTAFKPAEDPLSFEQLKEINPEVLGWITIYGTGVDYPYTQGEDNFEYLTKDAQGEYSPSGSIYLDSRNAPDLSDYNSFFHGHDMAASAMFGDLDKFNDGEFFKEHLYGNLFTNGRSYGLRIFAFALVDAYNTEFNNPGVMGEEAQKNYLSYVSSFAVNERDCGQAEAEHILLLSTCNGSFTNGRSILMCVLTDETYEDPFYVEEPEKEIISIDSLEGDKNNTGLPLWIILILVFLVLLVLHIAYSVHLRRVKKKYIQKMNEYSKNEGSK